MIRCCYQFVQASYINQRDQLINNYNDRGNICIVIRITLETLVFLIVTIMFTKTTIGEVSVSYCSLLHIMKSYVKGFYVQQKNRHLDACFLLSFYVLFRKFFDFLITFEICIEFASIWITFCFSDFVNHVYKYRNVCNQGS